MSRYEELRALAGKATRGPWKVLTDSDWGRDGTMTRDSTRVFGIGSGQVIGHGLVCGPYMDHWGEAQGFRRSAPYIAAASPDVILALLDERERLREALRRAASHVPQGAPDALHDLETYIWPLLKDEPVKARLPGVYVDSNTDTPQ